MDDIRLVELYRSLAKASAIAVKEAKSLTESIKKTLDNIEEYEGEDNGTDETINGG